MFIYLGWLGCDTSVGNSCVHSLIALVQTWVQHNWQLARVTAAAATAAAVARHSRSVLCHYLASAAYAGGVGRLGREAGLSNSAAAVAVGC